jgi:hypothetical protein
MGISWMTRKEIVQSIPPAYTEWIGQQLVPATKRTMPDPGFSEIEREEAKLCGETH